MRKGFLYLTAMFLSASLFTACSDDDNETTSTTLDLNISGLEDLGDAYVYEGWIIVDGSAITTGVFTVSESGMLSKTAFEVDADQLAAASTFVLTIEPAQDSDPAPSDVHVLAGDFSGDNASLTIGHGAALGNDFADASGKYILATPTDGENNNEKSGIWFLEITANGPGVGLNLPTLPAGWAYEGWAVVNGTPVSTGTFISASEADAAAPYSGDMQGPPFPGEDLIVNAPAGLTFPTDLTGGTAVISIEPVPDNSPAPFTLKPLLGQIAADAEDHVTYDLGQNLNFPTGSAKK